MATIDEPRRQVHREHGPRFGASALQTALNLGPLASLPGSWKGTGFSVMWRPNNHFDQPPAPPNPIKRYLQLNLTSETLEFRTIPGQVPNRGLDPQADIDLYGLHYLQQVSDDDATGFLNAGEALHLEPGLFMRVPANNNSGSTQLPSQDTIVRMGSIPHGVTVVMQGPAPSATPVLGGPEIPPIFPNPDLPPFHGAPGAIPGGADVVGLGIQPVDVPALQPPGADIEHVVPEVRISNDIPNAPTQVQSNGPYPADFQEYVNDPNQVLRNANVGKEILGTITIELSTDPLEEAISQIPFLGLPSQPNSLTNNCFVESATATFWLEWVYSEAESHYREHHGLFHHNGGSGPTDLLEPFLGEPTYLQLQYSQTVILNFNGVLWPHIAVATLRLSNG